MIEKKSTRHSFVLTLSCPDRRGIVAAVTQYLFEKDSNILDSAQFGDTLNGRFFLRVSFQPGNSVSLTELEEGFRGIQEAFGMDASFRDAQRKIRTLILVSKFGHCLVDLLYRYRIGALPIEIPAIVSNHRDFEDVAVNAGIPFLYMPVTPDTRAAQEVELLRFIDEQKIDLVVLARYMQILSEDLCKLLRGRAINIHHSFLPSFKGARPYHQAFQRGVKLIGATAHYVTPELDEGPIIEQAVERVNHALSADDYVAVGRDIESIVLARAIKWHAEHRIILNGQRTIIFS